MGIPPERHVGLHSVARPHTATTAAERWEAFRESHAIVPAEFDPDRAKLVHGV